MKRSFFKVYPPDCITPYWHYKCEIRSWIDTPMTSKITLIVSIIVLIIAYTK